MNKRQRKKQISKFHKQIRKMYKRSGRNKEFMVLNFSPKGESKAINVFEQYKKVFGQEPVDFSISNQQGNEKKISKLLEALELKRQEILKIPFSKELYQKYHQDVFGDFEKERERGIELLAENGAIEDILRIYRETKDVISGIEELISSYEINEDADEKQKLYPKTYIANLKKYAALFTVETQAMS